MTYTTDFGIVPEHILEFLERNTDKLKGVSASGNRNWGDMFGASTNKISANYELSIVSNTFLKKINLLKPNISANAYLVSTG
ncbi:hypothetical protein COL90_08565 [Bacillus toyonensis]|nr:hypothetical protein COL90_08565 [Bacillus toyonensis]